MPQRRRFVYILMAFFISEIFLISPASLAQSTTYTQARLTELTIRQNEMILKTQPKESGARTKHIDNFLKLQKVSELNKRNQEKLNKASQRISKMNDKLQKISDKNRERLAKYNELTTKSLEIQKKLNDIAAKAAESRSRIGSQNELWQENISKMNDFHQRIAEDQMKMGTVTDILGKNLAKMSDINLKFMNKHPGLGFISGPMYRVQSRLRDISDRIAQKQMNMGSRFQTLSDMNRVTPAPSTADILDISDRSSLNLGKMRSAQERFKEILRVYE